MLRDQCVYVRESGSEMFCFKPSSMYTAECKDTGANTGSMVDISGENTGAMVDISDENTGSMVDISGNFVHLFIIGCFLNDNEAEVGPIFRRSRMTLHIVPRQPRQ